MARILYGTTFLLEDEPCLNLSEVNLLTPDGHERHRYQIVCVMRNGKQAEYRKDMGKETSAEQFRIPGGAWDKGKLYIEHTVGELREIADRLRLQPKMELSQSGDIIQGYYDTIEQKKNLAKGRKVYG